MVYGGFESKFEFIRPVLDRVRFIHGRIGNPGCMQVDIGDGNAGHHPSIAHFRQLWTASFLGFLRSGEGSEIHFVPELLGPEIYYARVFNGREESDRRQQSLLSCAVARECFRAAATEFAMERSGVVQGS